MLSTSGSSIRHRMNSNPLLVTVTEKYVFTHDMKFSTKAALIGTTEMVDADFWWGPTKQSVYFKNNTKSNGAQ